MFKKISSFSQEEAFRGILSYNTNITAFLVLILVFCFLFFFKPFELSWYSTKVQLVLVTGYAVCSFIGYSLAVTIFTPYNRTKWTRLLELCTCLTCFFIVWILVYGYTIFCLEVLFPHILDIEDSGVRPENLFVRTFVYTISTGGLIYSLIHMYDVLHSYKKSSCKIVARNLYNKGYHPKKKSNRVKFTGKNKNEHVELEVDVFICIKSEGHYIRLYYLCNKSDQVKFYFLRNTMKEIENQTINHSFIYRCHKSFFINLNFLNSVIGNSNKTHVYLRYFSNKIPVSKSKISYLKDKAKK